MTTTIFFYILISISIGLYFSKRVKTGDDFIRAVRNLPFVIIFAMVFATWFGVGLLSPAPGTWGSLAAVLLWYFAEFLHPSTHIILPIFILFEKLLLTIPIVELHSLRTSLISLEGKRKVTYKPSSASIRALVPAALTI